MVWVHGKQQMGGRLAVGRTCLHGQEVLHNSGVCNYVSCGVRLDARLESSNLAHEPTDHSCHSLDRQLSESSSQRAGRIC
jgi:hypothetical protein